MTQAACDFVSRLDASNCAAAICLGDLFEAYVGEPQLRGPDGDIVRALASLRRERGVPAVLIPGNRDFLAGTCLERAGLPVRRDWLRLELDGRRDDPVLITHGDLLMVHDHLYRLSRGLQHSSFFRGGSKYLPVWLRLWIARALRGASKRRHRRRRQRDTDPAAAVPVRRYHAPIDVVDALFAGPSSAAALPPRMLVCGHFHCPAVESRPDDRHLVTVGDWSDDGGLVALVWSPREAELRHSSMWP